ERAHARTQTAQEVPWGDCGLAVTVLWKPYVVRVRFTPPLSHVDTETNTVSHMAAHKTKHPMIATIKSRECRDAAISSSKTKCPDRRQTIPLRIGDKAHRSSGDACQAHA